MSSSILSRIQPPYQRTSGTDRPHRHRVLVWLLLPLLLVSAASAGLYVHTQGSAATAKTPAASARTATAPMKPADWFLQSVVTGDGALGWHQLCPDIQAQLPEEVLVQQANTIHAAAAREGVWPTIKHMGTHMQPNGGVVYVYRVTAHWPNGATQQETFSVYTQPSGCVEDVQTK
jgi:hypothetical protein